jgi:hypothetical protein
VSCCVCVCLHTRIIKLFQPEFPNLHLIICDRQTPTRKYTVWDFVFYRGEVATMIKVAVVRHAKYINKERDYVARNVAATSVTPVLPLTLTAMHCVQSHWQRYRHLLL